jgi:competence protein ComEC
VKLHFIDVDQGDSILIEDNGHFMLIDAGVEEEGAVVVKYLNDLGIEKLDYVIATHPHNDHIGGLDTVINAYKVGNVIMPDVSVDYKNYEELLEAIADHNIAITRPAVGDSYTLGSASFVIISPNASDYESLNDYSVGIKLTYGSTSFILTGDAQAVSEAEMLQNGIDLSADVLKLSHHGSSTSSTIDFLDQVDPEYAVISVGTGNKYEHPHSATMRAINDRAIKLYRTDEQGSIVFTSDGKTISVNVKPYVITASDMTSDAAEEAAIAKGY